MDTEEAEFIVNLANTITSAAEYAADEGVRAINLASMGMENTHTGKETLIKITVVAEPIKFSRTVYPGDDPEHEDERYLGDDAFPIETTSVIDALRMMDIESASSIRH